MSKRLPQYLFYLLKKTVRDRSHLFNLTNLRYSSGSISPFTKLWQSCRDLKIRPIAIFDFYSLHYSLAAQLQDNSRPKAPTKVEAERKVQQFTVPKAPTKVEKKTKVQQLSVSGWLIMNGGES